MIARHALPVVLAGILAACGAGSGSGAGASVRLTIFGAASLTRVLDRVEVAYASTAPGTILTISTDSSAALATQIEEGAPADVFLSADTTNPQKLVAGGYAAGEPVVFAANKLCVVVPAGNPAGIRSPADLGRPGVKVLAAGDEVPITRYARQLVANLATEAGYPADFATRYAANIVSREDNVRQLLAKIELGEGDAGIVYVTDARSSGSVATIDVPDGANVSASYAGIVVKASRNQEPATAFLAWLAGAEGQAILSTFGFQPPA